MSARSDGSRPSDTLNLLPRPAQTLLNDLMAISQLGRFVCLYPHVQADGDALGACMALGLALEKRGAHVAILTEEPLSEKLARVLPRAGAKLIVGDSNEWGAYSARQEWALTLDCSPGSRLGNRHSHYLRAAHTHVIDHHVPDDPAQDNESVWRDTHAPATCELVGVLLRVWEERLGNPLIDQEIATALLVGLLTDTGRFAYPNTRAVTLELTARLLQVGAPLAELSHELFQIQSTEAFRLQGYVGTHTEILAEGRVAFCFIPWSYQQALAPVGTDFEGLAALMRDIEGVDVALLIRQTRTGDFKGSLRSNDAFNSQIFAARFGGGGHVRASGFLISATEAGETEAVLNRLRIELAQATLQTDSTAQPTRIEQVPAERASKQRTELPAEAKQSLSLNSSQAIAETPQSLNVLNSQMEGAEPVTRPLPLVSDLQGLLLINKPVGMTSFQVVARVRRLTGQKRVGHCGTLDPFAEGVLPICIGRATHAIPYLDSSDKAYRARLVLGAKTNTADCEGEILEHQPVTDEQIQNWLDPDSPQFWQHALAFMEGVQEQIPPMFSAIKHQGQPLYALARKGETIERKPRAIKVYRVEGIHPPHRIQPDEEPVRQPADPSPTSTASTSSGVIPASGHPSSKRSGEPPATPPSLDTVLEVGFEVSKGTYVRTLGEVLAEQMGTVAYLDKLTRTAAGVYQLKDSVELDALTPDNWREVLLPTDRILQHFPAVNLSRRAATRILQGQRILAPAGLLPDPSISHYRLYHQTQFLGLGCLEAREGSVLLRAERMFTTFDTTSH